MHKRFEPNLYEMEKNKVFFSLCSPVLVKYKNIFLKEKYRDTFSRFHISHIGMSSFNTVTMVLVTNEKRDFRFLWQQREEEIQEAYVTRDNLKKVACQAITNFRNAIK